MPMKQQNNNIEHQNDKLETIYFAGGCLWGVQEFMKYLPGIITTQAGRANGTTNNTKSDYDGYAECVKVTFDNDITNLHSLIGYLFEIIDPYSINQQGEDIGKKYRTGIYSNIPKHLQQAIAYIEQRDDADKIAIEVLPLTNYVKSDDEHQERLTRFPNDYCHIPNGVLHKYKND